MYLVQNFRISLYYSEVGWSRSITLFDIWYPQVCSCLFVRLDIFGYILEAAWTSQIRNTASKFGSLV